MCRGHRHVDATCVSARSDLEADLPKAAVVALKVSNLDLSWPHSPQPLVVQHEVPRLEL